VVLPSGEAARFEAYCHDRGYKKSTLIARLIREHLEKERGCCARSRNLRLAAIHCFMRYAAKQDPEFLSLAGRVLAIPNKHHAQPLLGYLTVEQVQAILDAPDSTTFSGRRDRLFFQLLYNTGARVSELVGLNRQDLLPDTCQTVTLHGKGRKERTVPLWPKTARQMRQWLDQLPPEVSTPVFINRWGTRVTRFGMEHRLSVAAAKAVHACPSLRGHPISPHVFRHTTAMHLLQSGVDVTAIALWLGHESPLTTHKYIEADLEMKKKTLNHLKGPKTTSVTYRPKDALLAFLESAYQAGADASGWDRSGLESSWCPSPPQLSDLLRRRVGVRASAGPKHGVTTKGD
jgi:site-specific recombinase XerD